MGTFVEHYQQSKLDHPSLCYDCLSEPIFNIAFGGLQIEFIARLEPVSNIMEKNLKKNRLLQVLDVLKSNQNATVNMIIQNTDFNRGIIDYQLNILKKFRVITRIGTRKNGSWQIDELYASDEKMTEKIEEITEKTSEKNTKASEKTSEKTSEKNTKMSEKILGLLSSKPEITISELAESLVLSTRSVERNLNNLQNAGKIERIGPDKGGYWNVKIKQDYKDVDDVLAALAEEPKLLYDALKKIIDSKKK